MTKRIFHSIFAAALAVFFFSVALFLGALYDYFSDVQQSQLKMQTELAAQAAAHEGVAYFEGLDVKNYRITWIAADGSVRYDSKSDTADMENHLEREEVQQAFSRGLGQSSRYSATLMERSLYCAKLLPDGTVLRLSIAQNTLLTLFLGMLQPVCAIFLGAVILSLVLSYRLSQKIVKPLNQIDLDHPLENGEYDELSPLLRRIDAQQRQIRRQSGELQQKQIEFETVTSGMKEGIVLLNRKGAVLSANPAAFQILEISSSPVGNSILAVNRSLELQELLRRSENGEYAEAVLELGGGEYQLNASPVVSDGQISGTVLLLFDVGEKRKAEQMRREFTANVSHELKTPLQTISGCSELLANGIVKPEDVAGFGGRIYAEAQRMISLIEDIIKLSHLDEGAGDLRRGDIDLYSLAESTLQALQKEADAAGVTLSLKGEHVRLWGVAQPLDSILFNLCDNAIKYNRPKGSVTVKIEKHGESVVLSVSDTGIGIAEEYRERIFERFYRVDKSHSKEVGGTGLGLSIVKHAAKLHHAAIDVQSALGVGTTITLRFPCEK